MDDRERHQDNAESDERGAEPPAEDAEADSGSMGNPESDEEALSHKQQEQDAPAGDD